MRKVYCIILLLLLLENFKGMAQTDTVFWFAPPDVSNQHDHSDDYIEIRLANADTFPVKVSITQPANLGGPISSNPAFQNLTIPVGGDQSINLSSTKARGNTYK